jgi:hypothetical protein
MTSLLPILTLIFIVWYTIDMFLNPEKHIVGLVILAILYAIFGSFYETSGAKADYDRKKRG